MENVNSININKKSSGAVIAQYGFLLSLVALYVFNVAKYLWSLPAMSDPLQYIGPASWNTTWAYFSFIDRLALAVNLRIFVLLFSKAYFAGMFYIGFINTAILIVAMIWAFRKSGFWAALFVGIFMNSSYLMLGWATYIYPDQTVALYSLLAFICFFSEFKIYRFINGTFLAGVLTGFAILSKATGFGILLFFVIYLIYKKEWKKILNFFIGFAVGLGLVVLLFMLLYNRESLVNTYQMFMNHGLKTNLNIFLPQEPAGFFHEYLLSMKYFPYLAIFIALGAYKIKEARRLFLAAWTTILMLIVIRPSGPSIPTYIYTAYIFICLGFSLYLSGIINRTPIKEKYEKHLWWIVSILILILMVLGLGVGYKYGPTASFGWAYNYITPLDVYNLSNLIYPLIIKRLYAFMPIIILIFLSALELFRSKKLVIAFMLLVSFYLPFSNGGLGYQKAKYDRDSAAPFYEIAPLLNKVKAKQFSVYIQELNTNYEHCARAGCLLNTYRLFFNEKYQKDFLPKYKSQFLNDLEIADNITYITKEEDLLSQAKGEQIITDSPETIYSYFPFAKELDKVSTPDGERTLTILDISEKGTLQKTVYFSFEQDLNKWTTDNIVEAEDIKKALPPLQITGLRGGNFEFIYSPSKDGNSFSVGLKNNSTVNNPEINFGYSLKNESGLERQKQLYVSLDIEARLTEKKEGLCFIFAQDKTIDWSVLTTQINDSEWKQYSISKKLREGASDIIGGVSFKPQSLEDRLEIRKIKISIWALGEPINKP